MLERRQVNTEYYKIPKAVNPSVKAVLDFDKKESYQFNPDWRNITPTSEMIEMLTAKELKGLTRMPSDQNLAIAHKLQENARIVANAKKLGLPLTNDKLSPDVIMFFKNKLNATNLAIA
jgi:GTP cyclohydrolase II